MSEWIKTILKNRDSKTSILYFVETDEFSRPLQLLNAMRGDYQHILLYDAWNGLQEVQFSSTPSGGGTPIMTIKKAGGDFDASDPLSAFVSILNRLKESEESPTLAVVEHFDILSKKINGVPDLNDALRYLIRQYDYSPKVFGKSLLVLFLNHTGDIAKDVLDHSVTIKVIGSSTEERKSIVESMIKAREKMGKWLPETHNTDGLVEAGGGLTIIQFKTSLVMGLAVHNLSPEYIASAKKLILETSGIGKIITPEEALDPAKIGGYDEIKHIINSISRKITENDRAKRLGCGNVRGILLMGYAGVGKSLFGEAFAKLTNKPVVSISAGDIFSKWYGESARTIKKIIEIAEESGAVIFIDEIDAVVGGRGGNGGGQTGQHEETARTLGELLRYMGDYKRRAIVIGTTNRPDLLDFAMKRAGRFDKILYIPLPDLKARKAIFKIHTKTPIDHPEVALGTDVDLTVLAKNTENFTGAEIGQVVKDATDFAFEDNSETVNQNHFMEAIEANKPNMTERIKMIQTYQHYANEFCRGLRGIEKKTGTEEEFKKEDLGRFLG